MFRSVEKKAKRCRNVEVTGWTLVCISLADEAVLSDTRGLKEHSSVQWSRLQRRLWGVCRRFVVSSDSKTRSSDFPRRQSPVQNVHGNFQSFKSLLYGSIITTLLRVCMIGLFQTLIILLNTVFCCGQLFTFVTGDPVCSCRVQMENRTGLLCVCSSWKLKKSAYIWSC